MRPPSPRQIAQSHSPHHRLRTLAQWRNRPENTAALFAVMRHAERADAWNAFVDGERWAQGSDYAQWPLDPPLSDEGMLGAFDVGLQLKELAERACQDMHVVVSSPYLRCLQTAVEVCRALGPKVRLMLDLTLGEVYGPCVMGESEPAQVVRPVAELLAYSRSKGVECLKLPMGKWPTWPEDLKSGRKRYVTQFLLYLRRGAKAKRNFVVVTHADCVATALRVMPSFRSQVVSSVESGGYFLAQRSRQRSLGRSRSASPEPAGSQEEFERSAADSSDSGEEEDEATKQQIPGAWQVQTVGIELQKKPGSQSSFLQRMLPKNVLSPAVVDELLGDMSDKPIDRFTDTGKPRSAQIQRTSLTRGTKSSLSLTMYLFGKSKSNGSLDRLSRSNSSGSLHRLAAAGFTNGKSNSRISSRSRSFLGGFRSEKTVTSEQNPAGMMLAQHHKERLSTIDSVPLAPDLVIEPSDSTRIISPGGNRGISNETTPRSSSDISRPRVSTEDKKMVVDHPSAPPPVKAAPPVVEPVVDAVPVQAAGQQAPLRTMSPISFGSSRLLNRRAGKGLANAKPQGAAGGALTVQTDKLHSANAVQHVPEAGKLQAGNAIQHISNGHGTDPEDTDPVSTDSTKTQPTHDARLLREQSPATPTLVGGFDPSDEGFHDLAAWLGRSPRRGVTEAPRSPRWSPSTSPAAGRLQASFKRTLPQTPRQSPRHLMSSPRGPRGTISQLLLGALPGNLSPGCVTPRSPTVLGGHAPHDDGYAELEDWLTSPAGSPPLSRAGSPVNSPGRSEPPPSASSRSALMRTLPQAPRQTPRHLVSQRHSACRAPL